MIQEACYRSQLEAQFSSSILSIEGASLEYNSHNHIQSKGGMLKRTHTCSTAFVPRPRYRKRPERDSVNRILQHTSSPALSPRRRISSTQDSVTGAKPEYKEKKHINGDPLLQVHNSQLRGESWKLLPRMPSAVQSAGIQQHKIKSMTSSTKPLGSSIGRKE